MSTDLVHVRVVAVEERKIRFVLTLIDPSGEMCIDEAFVLELFGLGNPSEPDVVGGPPIRVAELEDARRRIGEREPEQVLGTVKVTDVANYPEDYQPDLAHFRSRPRESWPRATYEIGLRFKDLMRFVAVGTELVSTAYDERHTGAMVLPGGKVQRRWPGEPFSHVYTATRTSDLGLEIEVTSGAELPVPAPHSWLEIVRTPLRAVESDLPAVHHPFIRAPRYLRSVALMAIEGAREAKGAVYLAEGALKAAGTVRKARYRLELTDSKWFAAARLDQPFGKNSGFRSMSFMPDPDASTPGDAETFEELLALAREEDAAAELATLQDGLRGSRDVVIAALKHVGALGDRAAPLVALVAERIGALDADVVCAASAAAAGIGSGELAPSLAIASLRMRASDADRRASDRAAAALASLNDRPRWCDAFIGEPPERRTG